MSNSGGNLEASASLNSLHMDYSESDLESLDYLAMPTSAQLASYMSSYHKRQAFGMELESFFSILGYNLLLLEEIFSISRKLM